MTRYRIAIAALLAMFAAPSPTFAQPAVFYDDFDGVVVPPHWVFPLGTPEYQIENGMMTITGTNPPAGLMMALNMNFAPQENYRIDVRMGLDAGNEANGIGMYVMWGGHPYAHIGYRNDPLAGSIVSATGWHAFPNSQTVSIPGPTSGIFDFAMERTGGLIDFYFDGNLFASLPGGAAAATLMFEFSGSPTETAPLYLDYVQVVPAPSALLILTSGLTLMARPRRRR